MPTMKQYLLDASKETWFRKLIAESYQEYTHPKRNDFMVECDCGCGNMRFTQYKEDNEIYIEYYASSFYAKQDGIFKTIWKRIKFAFLILIGKEFYLYDIVLSGEKADHFRENIKRFIGEQ